MKNLQLVVRREVGCALVDVALRGETIFRVTKLESSSSFVLVMKF